MISISSYIEFAGSRQDSSRGLWQECLRLSWKKESITQNCVINFLDMFGVISCRANLFYSLIYLIKCYRRYLLRSITQQDLILIILEATSGVPCRNLSISNLRYRKFVTSFVFCGGMLSCWVGGFNAFLQDSSFF